MGHRCFHLFQQHRWMPDWEPGAALSQCGHQAPSPDSTTRLQTGHSAPGGVVGRNSRHELHQALVEASTASVQMMQASSYTRLKRTMGPLGDGGARAPVLMYVMSSSVDKVRMSSESRRKRSPAMAGK